MIKEFLEREIDCVVRTFLSETIRAGTLVLTVAKCSYKLLALF